MADHSAGEKAEQTADLSVACWVAHLAGDWAGPKAAKMAA